MGNKSLTRNILMGILIGAIVGIIIQPFSSTPWIETYITEGLLYIIGSIFITLMKMLVVPLVFVSIVCGTSNAADPKSFSRIGGKTLALYIITTAIAITFAINIALLFNVGSGADIALSANQFTARSPQSLTETLLSLFTSNPIDALAQGHMLQIIVFALLSEVTDFWV